MVFVALINADILRVHLSVSVREVHTASYTCDTATARVQIHRWGPNRDIYPR